MLAMGIVFLNNDHWLFRVLPRYSAFIQKHNENHLQPLWDLASEGRGLRGAQHEARTMRYCSAPQQQQCGSELKG